MNRTKYGALALKTLEEYSDSSNYLSTRGKINHLIEKDWNISLRNISRDTQLRALKDLVELGFLKKKGYRYVSREAHEKQKKVTIKTLKKGFNETAKEFDILRPKLRRIVKRITEEAGTPIEYPLGVVRRRSKEERRKITEEVEKL